ncbi:MAG: DUF2065 domain-containing protein [Magnetococcales bacterium]|nr:DUF2065 domain-containing protein [Magnetococcales bacterium]NGZ26155.1 DUF2065 domain-containing protein [Magnetococcales bacterium]
MHDFLTALGLVMIIEGLPYFISPAATREWLQKLSVLPDATLRQAALGSMFMGLFIIYLVRG